MIMYKLILKLISTKARRRSVKTVESSVKFFGKYNGYKYYLIEIKAFGIYWVKVNGYGFYYKRNESI